MRKGRKAQDRQKRRGAKHKWLLLLFLLTLTGAGGLQPAIHALTTNYNMHAEKMRFAGPSC